MKIQTVLSTIFVTGVGLILIGQAPVAFAGGGGGDDPTAVKSEAKAKVKFEADSAALDTEARAHLGQLATWAMESEDREIVITGEMMGAEERQLREQRAQATRDYLISLGVDRSRIRVATEGEQISAAAMGENQRVVYIAQRDATVGQPAQTDVETEVTPQGDVNVDVDVDVQDPYARQDQPAEPEAEEPVATEPIRDPAYASPMPAEPPEEDQPRRPASGVGIGLSLGGGVLDYLDSDTREFTGTAGTWEARLTYGTRAPVAIEAAYVGYAQSVDALGLAGDNTALLGSLGEANVRLNVPLGLEFFQPYVFGGVGYTRVDIVNDDVNTSNLEDRESAFHFPVGAGLGFRYSGLLFDLRGTVRPTVDDQLIRPEANAENARLHSWAANAKIGWEF